MSTKSLKPGFQVWLELDGKRVMGHQEAQILSGIKKFGSFMATSRAIGMSYAHVWNTIDQLSSTLDQQIVEARKGGEYGGGAKLTKSGLSLLEKYNDLETYVGRGLSKSMPIKTREFFELRNKLPEFTVAGSDCFGIKILLDMMLKKEQFSFEVASIGSSGGLTTIMLGEADVAGVHLLDEDTNEYNISFLKRYWVSNQAVLVRGYLREIGFIIPKGNPKNVSGLDDLLRRDIRFINRPLGSGTRTLIDIYLSKICENKGLKFRDIVSKVKGYQVEVKSHNEAAKAIANGKADVAFGLKAAAVTNNLDFIKVMNENFDFVVDERRLKKPLVKLFIEKLSSKEFTDRLLKKSFGLKTIEETGKIIYKP